MNIADPKVQSEFGFMYRTCGDTGARRAIVALHGSGADESSMLPLAHAIDPDAFIIAPCGRVNQNGERRWFLKHSPVEFDQQSILTESRAFAAFLEALYACETLHPARTVFLGYSNGGNLVHSTLMLHPASIAKAVLLRCMPVLKQVPMGDLRGKQVLVVAGATDLTYKPFAPALAQLLTQHGASTRFETVAAGHEFGEDDVCITREWLLIAENAPSVSS